MVKRFIDERSGRGRTISRHLPVVDGPAPEMRFLRRKAILPAPAEVDRNPRARSARLRVAERLAADDPETDRRLAA